MKNINLIDDNIYCWESCIIGPVDTPYEGGLFILNISFPQDYPFFLFLK